MAKFKFTAFSTKQKQILTWWMDESPHSTKDGIICDGSVRSGKTSTMSLSYIQWSMSKFDNKNFGMAGKTISSFRRNVWTELVPKLRDLGYRVYRAPDTHDAYIIKRNGKTNTYFIFGGKDERSQDLVQGFTAAGFFFDEVTLMPESFVNQAIARCSVEGAKYWFNCNPSSPFHWFKEKYLDKLEEKNLLHIHCILTDNPSLSAQVIERYKRLFTGVFYERYILGHWVIAEGVIYSMFKSTMVISKVPSDVVINKKFIGVDYGQSNATVFLLVGFGSDNKVYVLDEYYHSGKDSVIQKSPSKYSQDYFNWKVKNGVEGMPVNHKVTYIDPSAKGFIRQLHDDGENKIHLANNTVSIKGNRVEELAGIELVSSIIDCDKLRVLSHCKNTINEFGSYRWDLKAQEEYGEDKPIKQNDHCMDALRYVCNGCRLDLARILKETYWQQKQIQVIERNKL